MKPIIYVQFVFILTLNFIFFSGCTGGNNVDEGREFVTAESEDDRFQKTENKPKVEKNGNQVGVVPLGSGGIEQLNPNVEKVDLFPGDEQTEGSDDGLIHSKLKPANFPNLIIANKQIQSLTAGGAHTCALFSDGRVQCWGENEDGQIGVGGPNDQLSPTTVPGLTGVTHISTGGFHTCAVSGGKAFCWGRNTDGQLGDGSKENRSTPTEVAGLTNVVKVAAGGAHSCALTLEKNVYCWGRNEFRQLGLGPDKTADETNAQLVPNLNDILELRVGNSHSCAVKKSAAMPILNCWGSNYRGKTGIGTENSYPANVASPEIVTLMAYLLGLKEIPALSLGGNHSCAILDVLDNRSVWCWGDNYHGQFGNGEHNEHSAVPRNALSKIYGATGITTSWGSLSNFGNTTGGTYTCAIKDGLVYCWGDSQNLGMGLGDQETYMEQAIEETGSAIWNPSIPMRVFGVKDAKQIVSGAGHTCVLKTDGNFACWGMNASGQLGNGSKNN